MLLKDLKPLVANINMNPYCVTNIEGVEIIGQDIVFEMDQSEIDSLEKDIEDNETVISNLESDIKSSKEEYDTLKEEADKLREILDLYKNDKGETINDMLKQIKDLEAQNLQRGETIAAFRKRVEEDIKEIKNLRARKNKGMISRCSTTGKQICEFKGVKYYLEIIKP